MLDSTTVTALELNLFVFLSALFVYFKQYVSEQPVTQLSDDSAVKPFTGSKLTKRKDLQKTVQPVNKPPSGYLPICNSREGLTHTVSDSNLSACRVNASSSASSISLIDFNKDLNGKPKCNIGVNRSISKQQITASSENLNMAQFEMHTSLRIKRPPSGKMSKECFVNKTAKSVSIHDKDFIDKSASFSTNSSENGSSDHEQVLSCNHNDSNQQLQSTAIITDSPSYLIKTLSSHGETLETDNVTNDDEEPIQTDMQDVSKVNYIQYLFLCSINVEQYFSSICIFIELLDF